MIRQPSPAAQLYAWHRAAVAGDSPATFEGLPECGWFRTRLRKGGPWAAVQIFCQREIDEETGELTAPERICGEINGNPLTQTQLADLWTWLTPITAPEYRTLFARIAATPAMHDPYRKIDLITQGVKPQ
jgi:hypothetical protein